MSGLIDHQGFGLISRRRQIQHVLACAGAGALCAVSMLPTAAKADAKSVSLLAALTHAANGDTSARSRLPAGRYVLTEPVRLEVGHQRNTTLDLNGVELVFNGPSPRQNQAFFHVRAAVPGQSLLLKGLTVHLGRPSVRTPGSDMIRLSGFAHYELDGVRVLSADNMALCIGRGDPFSFTPDTIVVANCEFGGWVADQPHSHASIGDTAIWVITPARRMSIRHCRIKQTGDDAIYVGHSASTEIEEVAIENNTIDSCSGGIGVAVPHARIKGNHIRRTNNAAIRCEVQNGNQASNCLIADNTIVEAGQLSGGELGQQMIPKWHPHAIWVYQGGGNICIENNDIERCRGSGIVLMPHREQGALSNVCVRGGLIRGVGVDDDGRPTQDRVRHAVIRRGAVAGQAVRGFSATDVEVEDLGQPLLVWINRECTDDDPPVVDRVTLRSPRLGSTPLVFWEGAAFSSGQARVSYIAIDAPSLRHLQSSERWLDKQPRPNDAFVITGK